MSTKDVLLQQLEAERFKRKTAQEQLEAINRGAEGEVGPEDATEVTIEKLEAEIALIDTVIAECEKGIEELKQARPNDQNSDLNSDFAKGNGGEPQKP